MSSQINCSSIELWKVNEDGLKVCDPKNLTPRELMDKQVNAFAINIINLALSEKDKALTTTNETWNHLKKLFIGNKSIQESEFEEVNNEADNFAKFDG
jgi:hypothetical protein